MDRNNGGDALNAKRDESGEVGMKTSTVGGHVREVSSKLTGCFGEVQGGRNNGGDLLNALRDEYGEFGRSHFETFFVWEKFK